ncbi:hypothetical protein FPS14_contig00079-0007 [Flavobacterium psychrophilum]|nr:hypothetical protein FPS14_contig00079-0007 [Flavobacterium psychrophilum]
MQQYYNESKAIQKLNNATAPTFNYANHKGGTTKLEDFKGKYIYIDVWATWCGPCRGEIPFLQKIEEKYHEKISNLLAYLSMRRRISRNGKNL